MKRTVAFFAIFVAAIFSCSKAEHTVDIGESGVIFKELPARISMSDISQYASEQVSLTKSTKDPEIIPIIIEKDTLMFLVNYEEGWELLAADRRAPRVLMMCEKGSITPDELRFNPVQSSWIDNIIDGLSSLAKTADKYLNVSEVHESQSTSFYINYPWTLVNTQWTVEADEFQNHLMVTRWGQGYPWNARTPYQDSTLTSHCPTGCTNVAVSQLLYYLHYYENQVPSMYGVSTCNAFVPSSGGYVSLTSSNIRFEGATDSYTTWDLMPYDSISPNATTTNCGCVSTLMVRVGYFLQSKYYANKTSTVFSAVSGRLYSGFNVSSTYSSSYDYGIIHNQIINRLKPVLLSISYNDDGRKGHTVVADGFKYRKRYFIKTYVRPIANGLDYEYRYEDGYVIENYVAINWGWNGNGDSNESGTIWYDATSNWTTPSNLTFDSFDGMIYGF